MDFAKMMCTDGNEENCPIAEALTRSSELVHAIFRVMERGSSEDLAKIVCIAAENCAHFKLNRCKSDEANEAHETFGYVLALYELLCQQAEAWRDARKLVEGGRVQ